MKGKERCKILKEIRQKIADENDIAYVVSECTHKGDCLGTCPKCEAELRYLERELEKRQKMGKAIAVVGLAAGLTFGTVGCADPFAEKELGGDPLPPTDPGGKAKIEELAGDMPAAFSIGSLGGLNENEIVNRITNSGCSREMLRTEWADARMTGGETFDRYVIPDDGRVIYISEVDGKLVVTILDIIEFAGDPAPQLPSLKSIANWSSEDIVVAVQDSWQTKEMIRSEWADILVSEDDVCDQYRLEDGRMVQIREEDGKLVVAIEGDNIELDGEPAPQLPSLKSIANWSSEDIVDAVQDSWQTKEMIRSEWADILISEDDACDQYRLQDGRVILIWEEEGQVFAEVKYEKDAN